MLFVLTKPLTISLLLSILIYSDITKSYRCPHLLQSLAFFFAILYNLVIVAFMKTSISLFLSDILPHRRKLFHKIVKNKIFKNQASADVLDHLKTIGLDGFELMLPQYATTTDADVLEVKKLVMKYNFPVLSVHQSLRFFTATKVKEIARLF